VRGVTRLDDQPIGDGEVGPWTRQLAVALAERERQAAAAPGR